MFAIMNCKSGKFLYGTDFRYNPPRQRTSKDMARLYRDEEFAESDMRSRRCGANYKVVEVELTVKR